MRVSEHRLQILAHEVRVVFKYPLFAPPRRLESEQEVDANARALDARTTAARSRVGYDSFAPFHGANSWPVDSQQSRRGLIEIHADLNIDPPDSFLLGDRRMAMVEPVLQWEERVVASYRAKL